MDVIDYGSSVLLLIEKEKLIIPLNPTAFTIAQDSESQLNKIYSGALVVIRDGTVLKIEKINRKGLWGKTILRKIISLLTSVYEIEVKFDIAKKTDFEELKRLIVRLVEYDVLADEPGLLHGLDAEGIKEAVLSSSSCEEIFDVLKVPPVNECLDVL